jgi:hypothetical protein
MSDDDRDPKERLANPIARRVRHVIRRLVALDLLELNDEAEGEWRIRFITNHATGDIVPAVTVGDCTYWEEGRDLIAQRPASGLIQWTRVDDDGKPAQAWRCTPPRPEDAVLN